ncbi:MAG: branched-chain amino acid ABC transporter permease [Alphaproteobacteria bacterium]|nr:branched-chain amino acid ABC transporter permease [Alphaproteobacteria bacterium]
MAPRWPWILVAVAVIALLPHLLGTPYWRGILVICAMNVMLALSLNLILGYTGQLNLGQSGFFAVGAYVTTVLVKSFGWGFWPAALAAVAAAGTLGLLLALFAVRLRGHYLAIASLGFAVITYQVLVNWESMTEGVRGIYAIRPPPPIRIDGLVDISFSSPMMLFYLVAGIALLVYLALDNVVRSPIGETLRAIREDEVSAASLGIDAARWKAFAFGLGAAVAGLAGCFYPSFVGTLVPGAFNIVESFTMLAMVIVGGLGTMIGPVIGAVVLTFLPELLRGVGELRLLVYGLALTLVVLFMPGGLVQAWQLLRARFAGGRP